MQPMNYCRQMAIQFSRTISDPNCNPASARVLGDLIKLAFDSQKFLLPDGGRLYNDPEYRALDDTKELNLPYPCIALEYSRFWEEEQKDNLVKSSKCILFAREESGFIVISPIAWFESKSIWAAFPEAAIPKFGYINRELKDINGYVGINIKRSDPRIPFSDYADEAGALLCFLNVLQCKNVHTERIEPRKSAKKSKAALPFDSYHILTIDSHITSGNQRNVSLSTNHRSPREHLRRGHIRRLGDGRRIWVNATVVSAGVGGVIRKDYLVKH